MKKENNDQNKTVKAVIDTALAVLVFMLAVCCVARASISWTPSFVQIPPQTITNIVPSPPIQIGTFYVTPPPLYIQTTNGATNFFVTGRFSFDNTNWYTVRQQYQAPLFPTNGPYILTNTSFAVYGSITVSNGDGTVLATNGLSVTSP